VVLVLPVALRALVRAAFAHRRKALARSLALAPGYGADVRERTREALQELGHPADQRAERLAPHEFRALAQALRSPSAPIQDTRSPGGGKSWA
jgi:16S rRNA (adenine1518-N6/adenine1519-N6)-dimethyltransferase